MTRRGPRQRGMTLIQVLIATTLGMVISLGVGSFFVTSARTSHGDIHVSAMLDELTFATAALSSDLEMAGFWAQVHDPALVVADASLALSGGDCGASGWYRTLTAVQVLDNPTPAAAAAAFPCLSASDLVGGSDIIAIKRVIGRVSGSDTDASQMHAGAIYLRTHNRYGLLYLQGAGTPAAVDAPYQNWAYAPALYFVQKYTTSASESPQVPSLCRMVLRSAAGAAPAFTRECVAQGVENLQIEIGVDTDEDGSANYFTQAPSASELVHASTARIYLQLRSAQADPDYVNEKTYQVGNAPAFTPSGAATHFYRKTLTTEVALHNPRALQGVAVE